MQKNVMTNQLTPENQEIVKRLGTSIQLFGTLIHDLGSNPMTQETALRIRPLRSLMELWRTGIISNTTTPPVDVEALQTQVKQLNKENKKLKKQQQELEQSTKNLEHDKAQLQIHLERLDNVYQALGIPRPTFSPVPIPSSSTTTESNTRPSVEQHKTQGEKEKENAELSKTQNQPSDQPSNQEQAEQPGTPLAQGKRKPSIEDLTTPGSPKPKRTKSNTSSGASTPSSKTTTPLSTSAQSEMVEAPTVPTSIRFKTRTTQAKKKPVEPCFSEKAVTRLLNMVDEPSTIIFPVAYDPDYRLLHETPAGDIPDEEPENDEILSACKQCGKELAKSYEDCKIFGYFFPTKGAHHEKLTKNAECLSIEILQEWIKLREPDKWYAKRPKHLRMVDPADLSYEAKLWLFEVLEFQCHFRWELYLRMFHFPDGDKLLVEPFWIAWRRFTKTRGDACRRHHDKLYKRSLELISDGELPPFIWFDPALFMSTPVINLYPDDYDMDFLDAMKYARRHEHHRTFWVDDPSNHPFYRLKLDQYYASRYGMPYQPVVEPIKSHVILPGFAAFLGDFSGDKKPIVPSYSSFFSGDPALRYKFTQSDFRSLVVRLTPLDAEEQAATDELHRRRHARSRSNSVHMPRGGKEI